MPQTAGSLTFLGALFVVLLTPVFAWLWPQLDKRGLNPSAIAKFGLGLVFAGLSMGILAYAAGQAAPGVLVSVWWLVFAYFVLELGEMVLSPIGLSAVTTLSVPRVVGLMMGAWFLFSAFGEMIAGRLATRASIAPLPDGTYDLAQALAVYGKFFTEMLWLGVGTGLVLIVLAPLLNRLTRERAAGEPVRPDRRERRTGVPLPNPPLRSRGGGKAGQGAGALRGLALADVLLEEREHPRVELAVVLFLEEAVALVVLREPLDFLAGLLERALHRLRMVRVRAHVVEADDEEHRRLDPSASARRRTPREVLLAAAERFAEEVRGRNRGPGCRRACTSSACRRRRRSRPRSGRGPAPSRRPSPTRSAP